MITAFFRTIILYTILIIGLRLTGKRQIGQLEPIELVLTMLLSDLASVPMQDFGIPLLSGVVPIVTLLALSTLLSYCSLRNVRFRSLVCGEPAIIIHDGKIQQDAMRKNRLTIDELLEEMRSQSYTDLHSIKYAILETSGQISFLPYTAQQPVTPQQMDLKVPEETFLPTVIINDGRLMRHEMETQGFDDQWLTQQLRRCHVKKPSDIFLLSIDEKGTIICLPKEESRP